MKLFEPVKTLIEQNSHLLEYNHEELISICPSGYRNNLISVLYDAGILIYSKFNDIESLLVNNGLRLKHNSQGEWFIYLNKGNSKPIASIDIFSETVDTYQPYVHPQYSDSIAYGQFFAELPHQNPEPYAYKHNKFNSVEDFLRAGKIVTKNFRDKPYTGFYANDYVN